MKNIKRFTLLILLVFLLVLVGCKTPVNNDDNDNDNGDDNGDGSDDPVAIIIDHTCTDISKIPDQWITKVKELLNVHYAHTSHGEQITVGLERLSQANTELMMNAGSLPPAASKYAFWYENCNMPSSTTHLTMMDGQLYDDYCETYVTPDLYWETGHGMDMTRSVLQHFTTVDISLWAWCTQQDYYSQAETQKYLDKMTQLEKEFPKVTFIYMTGNAQSVEQNRQQRNKQVRDYCINNKKILFDFEDLDCWYNGQQHKVDGIPTEHPHYHGDQAGHTTFKSCENKAKAFWWLLARIAGWDGKSTQ
ncbi:MAG: hypothetical protein L0Y73_01870 [Candidatus Aminicenantes bacterium]|nr:hypothetical protein [Candidatus Aminicenantes bacterium]